MDTNSDTGTEYYGPVTALQYLQWLTAHELDGHIGPFDETYAASQYLDLATDDDIAMYLESSSLYDFDQGQWQALDSLEHECDVRARLREIVTSIIQHFGKAPIDGSVLREVHDTNFRGLPHLEERFQVHHSSPALVIKATGPSFEEPAEHGDGPRLGYSNIASCFEILTEEDIDENEAYYTEQSSVFARYQSRCFRRYMELNFHIDKCSLNSQTADLSATSFYRRKCATCSILIGAALSTPSQSAFTKSQLPSSVLSSVFRVLTRKL